MQKIAKPQELQAELQRLLAYASSEKPSRAKLSAELNALADRVADTNRIAGESLLDYVLDRDALIDIQSKLRDEDRQSFDLFQQVYRQLRRELTLKSGAEGAFYRILDIVKRGKTWDIALLRNNVFKAANLLGINLPSGSF